MAIPHLYWMLQCSRCACRFVVYDTYLVDDPSAGSHRVPFGHYVGPELPFRYTCVRGCDGTPDPVAHVWSPDDRVMSLVKPHTQRFVRGTMPREWARLFRDASEYIAFHSAEVYVTDALAEEWRYLTRHPGRCVVASFPLATLLDEFVNGRTVVMRFDDGMTSDRPSLGLALEWFELTEPGRSLSFIRPGVCTLQVSRQDAAWSARLEGASRPLVRLGVDEPVVRRAVVRFLGEPDGEGAARVLMAGAGSSVVC